MARCRGFLLCAFPALSTVLLASGGERSALGEGTGPGELASERGVPALFSWADFDGDGRLDLAAVSDGGTLQLLSNAGEGRFEDVTERLGLGELGATALALWADYDGDGRLDLFVGARAGASRLLRNEGGAFLDMSAASGLAIRGTVRSAEWLDHDGDGRVDLFVVTAERSELYRGLEGGFFEQAELPLAGATLVPAGNPLVGVDVDAKSPDRPLAVPRPSSAPGTNRSGREASALVVGSGGHTAPAPSTSGGSSSALLASCLPAIRDQANPSSCVQASTTPALGKLFPISANLFVAVGGDVGIGTTSPTAKLHVAGTARIADTLTLAPSGDQALDVSTGSIYKGGALFIHTKGGAGNTALGRDALPSVTSGSNNTASGAYALRFNTTGFNNTATGASALLFNTAGARNTASGISALRYNAGGNYNTASGAYALRFNIVGNYNAACGAGALRYNTYGSGNTASGAFALERNTTGSGNTASGAFALERNTTGSGNTASGAYALHDNYTGLNNTASGEGALYSNFNGSNNTAIGQDALRSNTTGSSNIALGRNAGFSLTLGSNNIAIGNQGVGGDSATIRIGTAGTQTRAFIAGIRGVTTGVANAIPVLVDSAGQLGTVSSSRRFKEEIRDMGDATEKLLALRPVTFRYKPEVQSGERPLEYGLIAEEVAEVFPDLVVYDEEGKPFTVKYHLLCSMLLNELQRLREQTEARDEAQARELEEQRGELARLRGLDDRLAQLEARSAGAESRLIVDRR